MSEVSVLCVNLNVWADSLKILIFLKIIFPCSLEEVSFCKGSLWTTFADRKPFCTSKSNCLTTVRLDASHCRSPGR